MDLGATINEEGRDNSIFDNRTNLNASEAPGNTAFGGTTMEERDTRQAFAEPVFDTAPSTSNLAENERNVEAQLAMLGGGFDAVENEVDFNNPAYNRKTTTVLEEGEAKATYSINNKQSIQSATSFEMPSEPMSRKTAMVKMTTPKNN